MHLTDRGLRDIAKWKNAGFEVPEYNREEIIQKTTKRPNWIHFGAGNIFRAFQANGVQKMLNSSKYDKGIIVAEGYDYEIIDRMYRPHDNLSVLATLKGNGSVDKTVVGSITESLKVDVCFEEDWKRLNAIFSNPSLQIVSFTITEKGYSLLDNKGITMPAVREDFMNGPTAPQSYMGKVAALLYRRFEMGALPIAMVSMDNCSHNGDKLYEAIHTFAEQWIKNHLIKADFIHYIENPNKVSFPLTMIDKITPRPDASVETILRAYGLEESIPIQTQKNTYVASFVNAEECEYLVIEDRFPNGRPRLEEAGFLFTDRETVDKVEKMKVCTCLNPLHTALAVFGCVLGYQKISDEMRYEDLLKFVKLIGYKEGLPVVVNPKVLDPKEFLDAVVHERLTNPFMPDSPQRIATDTSQKLGIRFGETLKAYMADENKDILDLKMIPLVFACWFRYLMAVDDFGNEYTLSPDPMLEIVTPNLANLKSILVRNMNGERIVPTDAELEDGIGKFLHMKTLFGVDLYEVELAQLVKDYTAKLLDGKGAVRLTLRDVIKNENIE